MYSGYKVITNGYNTIKDISQGNFKLHEAFFDKLLQISPTVRRYKRIKDIISCQGKILSDYKHAYNYFKSNAGFNLEEVRYMKSVYDNLFQESLKGLDALLLVLSAGQLRMSDDERLQAIDRIYIDMTDKLAFLRSFNNSTKSLAIQRLREQAEINLSRTLSDVR